jgi:hypothetical protein
MGDVMVVLLNGRGYNSAAERNDELNGRCNGAAPTLLDGRELDPDTVVGLDTDKHGFERAS